MGCKNDSLFFKYLDYVEEITDNIDLIEYWDRNRSNFPKLWSIAIRCSLIPINSVDAERSFSIYKGVLKDKRLRLNEDKIKKLNYIKINYDK